MVARYRSLIPLFLLLSALSVHAAPDIPYGYRQVARLNKVPADLLYAVALTESGARLAQSFRPWPWTLNVAGTGYRYATRRQACAALHQFLRTTSPKRIDAGLGQINLGWNGHYFAHPCEALAPYRNLHLAATLLRRHYDKWQSWPEAVGRYHRPAGGKAAQRYRQQVFRHL
ncbi:transglycosylase SLT domain-containing protein [Lonsdalea quercina]|uniref:transglycosylase SLT domain-containing protein n=1 Tax=Lonsdalea quercina TaxID=71657 RepID=UPI003976EF5A